MGLNDLDLPWPVIIDLYRKSLVDSSISPTSPAKPQPISGSKPVSEKLNETKLSDNNPKNILILVNQEANGEELELLNTMLSACKLSTGDVTIINRDQQTQPDSQKLLDQFRPKVVLLFAVEPLEAGLPISFPEFQVQNFSGKTFLLSPSLAVLGQDKLLKSKLWLCLRRIFGV